MNEGEKRELQKERDELRQRLEDIRQELQQPLDNDLDEQPAELQNRQNLIEIQRKARQRLARIEDVLSRMH
ncbi:MAG TPA: hypothetical protein VF254_02995 [Gammaproteobacteria bacterium]